MHKNLAMRREFFLAQLRSLVGQAYLAFFEDISDELRAKLGRDWKLWTNETLRFGYQIRNAVAHSGRLHFKSSYCTTDEYLEVESNMKISDNNQ